MIFLLKYYFYVNIAGFAIAGFDKFVAVSNLKEYFGIRRVSESTLLTLAAFGAFPGQSIAFTLFSHKTRKSSFRHAFVFATGVHLLSFLLLWQSGYIRYFL